MDIRDRIEQDKQLIEDYIKHDNIRKLESEKYLYSIKLQTEQCKTTLAKLFNTNKKLLVKADDGVNYIALMNLIVENSKDANITEKKLDAVAFQKKTLPVSMLQKLSEDQEKEIVQYCKGYTICEQLDKQNAAIHGCFLKAIVEDKINFYICLPKRIVNNEMTAFYASLPKNPTDEKINDVESEEVYEPLDDVPTKLLQCSIQ
jgi:hypothetical protein